MSFAQPFHRPSIATTSPSWLTTGIGGGGGSGSGSAGGYTSPGFSRSGSALGSAGSGNRQHEQELINAYEAEEERIINVLSRKLEQLREDKIELENALEAESESHVNKLLRELGTLRQANRELETQLAEVSSTQSPSKSPSGPSSRPNLRNLTVNPNEPSMAMMLEAMQRENESLRRRLVDTERNYVRLSRLNEVYREELIDHRGRLGLPLDNLIGLTPSDRDPFNQPTHHRQSRSSSVSSSPPASLGSAGVGGYYPPLHGFLGMSGPASGTGHHQSHVHSEASSPSASVYGLPRGASSVASTSTQARPIALSSHPQYTHSVPIPRPPSQIHRPIQPHDESHVPTSTPSTPLSISPSPPSPSGSPYPLSPIYSASGASSSSDSFMNSTIMGRRYSTSTSISGSGASVANPASFVSVSTNMTTPPSSLGNNIGMAALMLNGTSYGVPQRGLSYPSVPPPSLSSSFGSPTVGFHMPLRAERDASMSPVEPLSRRESNASMNAPGSRSRRGSHNGGERRVAETGSLRRGSVDRGVGMPIGGRVAESGSLVGRSRAGSLNIGNLPETVVEGDADDTDTMELETLEDIVDEGETLQDLDALPARPGASARIYGGNDPETDGPVPAKSR